MYTKKFLISQTIILSLFLLCSLNVVYADSAKDIQKRMKKRIPEITELKSQELVGENNKGFLEARKTLSNKSMTATVSSENSDRKKIYYLIAKQQGTTPELVGSRRALTFAKKGIKGYWYQDSKGKWYKKK